MLAQSQLQDFLSNFRLDGDPVRVRNALLVFFPELVTTYGDVSALLAADFYDMLRDVPPSASSFRAAFAAPIDSGKAQGSVRWAVGPLFDEDAELFTSQILGATQRLVTQRGRDSMYGSAFADPVATGIARVPSGTDTCEFCIMLASRGPVYRSEVNSELVVGRGSNRTGYDALGRRLSGGIGGGVKARGSQELGSVFHDNCDCTTVVVRSPADYPRGYNPDRLLAIYEQGSGTGRYAVDLSEAA